MVSFKGTHFVKDVMRSKAPHNYSMKRSRPVILTCVRWYLAYSLSYSQLEDRRDDAGTRCVRRSLPINRWVLKYAQQLEDAFHRRKRLVRLSRRMDETYINVKGQWCYLYHAVDKTGQTIDSLLTEHRDEPAASDS